MTSSVVRCTNHHLQSLASQSSAFYVDLSKAGLHGNLGFLMALSSQVVGPVSANPGKVPERTQVCLVLSLSSPIACMMLWVVFLHEH